MSKENNLPEFDYSSVDEHKVKEEVIQIFEEARRKRDNYKKYGPLFILISGVVFLTLMFSLESKIVFLFLWVVSVLYCAALMLRAEYRYYKISKILGFVKEDEEDSSAEERINEENV